jgi:DNA gyrase inhibitor GyrI
MDIKIEWIPSCRIAYFRQIGPYGAGNVQTMEKLKEWARKNHLLDEKAVILGIAQDNPETTKAEECRYDTCLVIPQDFCIENEYINQGELLEGKYAIFTVSHTAEAIQKAWGEIFVELQNQGFQWDIKKPVIERYAAKMVKEHKCEICVPVC